MQESKSVARKLSEMIAAFVITTLIIGILGALYVLQVIYQSTGV